MHLIQIENRNPVVIYMGENRDVEIQVKYVDNVNNTVFYVYNQEISENIGNFLSKSVTIAVIVQDSLYKAEARISGKGGKRRGYNNTIMIEVVSEFKQETRRSAVRYDIRTKIKIYKYSESQSYSNKGDFICDAISEDISGGGMRLSLNHKLHISGEDLVVLEFSIIPNSTLSMYSIPSKMMRSYKNVSSYEYGFKFDFKTIPGIQEKLLYDIFNFKLSGTRSG